MEFLERSFRIRMVAPSLYRISTKRKPKYSSDQIFDLSITNITKSPQKVVTKSTILDTKIKTNPELPDVRIQSRIDSEERRSQSLNKERKEESLISKQPSTSPLRKARTKTPEKKKTLALNFIPRQFSFIPVYEAKILILEPVYEGGSHVVLFNYPPQCFKESRINERVKGSNQFKLYFHVSSSIHTYNSVINSFVFAGFKQHEEKYNVLVSGVPKISLIREFNEYQKVNHFPASKQLGRKDNLWKNINFMRRKFGKDYEICPKTYVIPEEYDILVSQMTSKNKLWILKPAAASCGRGIKLIRNPSDVPKKPRYIVSKYLSKPHTINGYKYDLRVYVCVTSFDPLKIFLYKDGLVRFATEQYEKNRKSLKKRFIHLTNFSVNKRSKNFIKIQNDSLDGEGSKWSFQALRKKYLELGLDFDLIFSKIEDIIIKTLISVEHHMISAMSSQKYRNTCFELYGFDVLIDENLKPWLLEVNILPSLSSSSPMDKKIKTSLMCDILTLTGIVPYKRDDLDKGSGKNLYRNISALQECGCLEDYVLSEDDLQILLDCEEEGYRLGDFKKIFPVKKNIDLYSGYFLVPRYNNLLLWKHLKSVSNVVSKSFKRQYPPISV